MSDCRADADGSVLAVPIGTSDTLMYVTVPNGTPLWTTDATEAPFDIIIGGERMTVGVVAVVSSVEVQFSSVTRAVNGVAKAHGNNDAVHIFQPCYVALI